MDTHLSKRAEIESRPPAEPSETWQVIKNPTPLIRIHGHYSLAPDWALTKVAAYEFAAWLTRRSEVEQELERLRDWWLTPEVAADYRKSHEAWEAVKKHSGIELVSVPNANEGGPRVFQATYNFPDGYLLSNHTDPRDAALSLAKQLEEGK